MFTFKSCQGTEYLVLFPGHFCFLFQPQVQMHKTFCPPLCISSFLQREGSVHEMWDAKALHWSPNRESKMPLQVTQDSTEVLRYVFSPSSHQWWLMLGVNVFTESPLLTPACPLSHWEIFLGMQFGRFGATLQWQHLPSGAKATVNQAIIAKGHGKTS